MSAEIIKTLVEQYHETRKNLAKELEVNFKPLFTEVFETFSNLTSVSWVQYTPHFNDGEPCEFSVYGFDFNTNDGYLEQNFDKVNSYIHYLENEVFPDSTYPYYTEELCQQKYKISRTEKLVGFIPDSIKNLSYQELKEYRDKLGVLHSLKTLLNLIPYEIYNDMFGDGVEVTVTREKIEVEEYDHD